MTQDQATPTSMYCRQCGYMLFGLPENRCPECGQAFDPADRRTYLRYPKGWLLRRWLRRASYTFLGLLLIASAIAARVGWLYWQWRSQQPLVAAIQRAGAEPVWHMTPSYFRVLLPAKQRAEYSPYFDERRYIYGQVVGVQPSIRMTGFDAILARIPNHPDLQDLELSDTDVSDEGLRVLEGWPQIQRLSLGKRITDAGLAHVAGLYNLEVLTLSQTQISSAGLAHLQNLKKLYELHLSDALFVTDTGMHVVAQLPGLRWLSLDNTTITDDGVAALAKASALDTLLLNGTKISDAGLVHLQKLGQLRQLLLVDTKVTDAGMDALVQVPALERVCLGRTGITDAGLTRLAKAPKLRYVSVVQTQVTPAAVEALRQSRPDLEIAGPVLQPTARG
jgi:ribosomal protein L37E